jgi:hypothetical protein
VPLGFPIAVLFRFGYDVGGVCWLDAHGLSPSL